MINKPRSHDIVLKKCWQCWCTPLTLTFTIGYYLHNLGRPWPWSYGSWIYNYLCNQCLSPLMFSIRARCTTLCDKVCQWLATGLWFSLGPPVSSTNKTDCHDITEILLKTALNTIKQTNTIWACQIKYKLFLPTN